VTEDSIEEKIIEKAAIKLKRDHLIIKEDKIANRKNETEAKVSGAEMAQMIRHGARQIISTAH
jgi:SNF2 family DNA or RNA helicase